MVKKSFFLRSKEYFDMEEKFLDCVKKKKIVIYYISQSMIIQNYYLFFFSHKSARSTKSSERDSNLSPIRDFN